MVNTTYVDASITGNARDLIDAGGFVGRTKTPIAFYVVYSSISFGFPYSRRPIVAGLVGRADNQNLNVVDVITNISDKLQTVNL